jgi:nucleotide-binding universal stress UspA family protein
VVLDHESATDAILEVARARDADLVVVGVHARLLPPAITGAGTAESIAAASESSVLAVPLPDGGASWDVAGTWTA